MWANTWVSTFTGEPMRTTFINPRRRKPRRSTKRRTTRRRTRRNNGSSALSNERRTNARLRRELNNMKMSNPRRRRRRSTRRRRPATRRRRRRNAGVQPFVAGNPYILANPRRRRRRSNPKFGGQFTLKKIVDNTMTLGGGAALGTAANLFALNNIEGDWLRNGARYAAAVFGGQMLGGNMGAAFAGATLYPLLTEVAAMLNLPVGTEADLDVLAADLEDIVGDEDEEMDVW